eukprot:5347610-Heterocapsa_arctica.AAC.1
MFSVEEFIIARHRLHTIRKPRGERPRPGGPARAGVAATGGQPPSGRGDARTAAYIICSINI